METLRGVDALRMAEEVTRLGGSFSVAFYRYSRKKGTASTELRTYERCTVRAQLPHEKWSVDGKHFFLFADESGAPKMCWRVLIRYMGFPGDDYRLKKIIWYE